MKIELPQEKDHLLWMFGWTAGNSSRLDVWFINTGYRVDDHPEAPWGGDRNVLKFTHLEIRIVGLPILGVIQVLVAFLQRVYTLPPCIMKGFWTTPLSESLPTYISTIIQLLLVNRAQMTEYTSPSFGYPLECIHTTKTNMEAERIRLKKQKPSYQTSGCLIFAGRHMPADRLIGNVFFLVGCSTSQVIKLGWTFVQRITNTPENYKWNLN